MVSFFLTSLAVILLSCPVTSRVYRTHDAIIIEGISFYLIIQVNLIHYIYVKLTTYQEEMQKILPS